MEDGVRGGTTLQQVLEASRSSHGESHYQRSVLTRFIAGASFVFFTDLPPTNDLAYAALTKGCGPIARGSRSSR